MKNADLLKRIEQLEKRIRTLEARPIYIPYAVPHESPPSHPYAPPTWREWWSPNTTPYITCGTGTSPAADGTTTSAEVPITFTAAACLSS